MNRAELTEAVADRLGSRKAAREAVDAVLQEIMIAVARGERVVIRGFGSFERRSDAGARVVPEVVFKPAARSTVSPWKAETSARRVLRIRRRLAGPPAGPDFPTDR